jgi:hypothetical protein
MRGAEAGFREKGFTEPGGKSERAAAARTERGGAMDRSFADGAEGGGGLGRGGLGRGGALQRGAQAQEHRGDLGQRLERRAALHRDAHGAEELAHQRGGFEHALDALAGQLGGPRARLIEERLGGVRQAGDLADLQARGHALDGVEDAEERVDPLGLEAPLLDRDEQRVDLVHALLGLLEEVAEQLDRLRVARGGRGRKGARRKGARRGECGRDGRRRGRGQRHRDGRQLGLRRRRGGARGLREAHLGHLQARHRRGQRDQERRGRVLRGEDRRGGALHVGDHRAEPIEDGGRVVATLAQDRRDQRGGLARQAAELDVGRGGGHLLEEVLHRGERLGVLGAGHDHSPGGLLHEGEESLEIDVAVLALFVLHDPGSRRRCARWMSPRDVVLGGKAPRRRAAR